MLESVPSHQLADIMASIVNATFNEKLDILNAVDLKIRFEKALPLLLRQIEGVKLLQEKQELEKKEGMLIVAYLLKLAKYVPKIQVSGIFHIFILYLISFSNWYALNVLQKLEKSSNIHQKIFILKFFILTQTLQLDCGYYLYIVSPLNSMVSHF